MLIIYKLNNTTVYVHTRLFFKSITLIEGKVRQVIFNMSLMLL